MCPPFVFEMKRYIATRYHQPRRLLPTYEVGVFRLVVFFGNERAHAMCPYGIDLFTQTPRLTLHFAPPSSWGRPPF